jgi:hypothetical protein
VGRARTLTASRAQAPARAAIARDDYLHWVHVACGRGLPQLAEGAAQVTTVWDLGKSAHSKNGAATVLRATCGSRRPVDHRTLLATCNLFDTLIKYI